MTHGEMMAEFDRIDAKIFRERRMELFGSNLPHVFNNLTIQEVIEYYQAEVNSFGYKYPKSSAECLMIIIQLMMIKIMRRHCERK